MSNLNRFSVFICNNYLPLFVSFYNSYKYYCHNTPLNVYNYNKLNTFNIQYLKKYVEVTHVDSDKYPPYNSFIGTYAFKFISLFEHMCENEIILDIDTNFLNNLDFVFEDIKNGNAIFAEECFGIYPKHYYKGNDWESEVVRIKKLLKKYEIKNLHMFHNEHIFGNYNAGFMGFNKSKHTKILKTVIDMLYDETLPKEYIFFELEQFAMSFLISLSPEIERKVLPNTEWMNTWGAHKKPKKLIKIIDEKFVLENEDGTKVNFYHYTGDIGIPNTATGYIVPARLFLLNNNYFKTKIGVLCADKEEVKKLWFIKHENPSLLLYEYFYNNGPATCPKTYNIDFRKNIANIFKTFWNIECDEESPCIIMTVLLYDYINLLGYRLIGNHQYYKILDYLTLPHKASDKTIGIDCSEATVSLSTVQPNNKIYNWFESINPNKCEDIVVENLNNVFITTNMKSIII